MTEIFSQSLTQFTKREEAKTRSNNTHSILKPVCKPSTQPPILDGPIVPGSNIISIEVQTLKFFWYP